MSTVGNRVTVATQATRLDTLTMSGSVLAVNRDASVSVDLGDSTVTTGAGFELKAGESAALDMTSVDGGLYAVAPAGTVRVDVLQNGI